MSIHNLMHVPAINDCPFCHREGCVVNDNCNNDSSAGYIYWVTCIECEASGPVQTDAESAINYWNGIGDSKEIAN